MFLDVIDGFDLKMSKFTLYIGHFLNNEFGKLSSMQIPSRNWLLIHRMLSQTSFIRRSFLKNFFPSKMLLMSNWRPFYNRPFPFNYLACNFRYFSSDHSSVSSTVPEDSPKFQDRMIQKASAKACEQSKKDEIDAVRKKVAELNEYFSQYIDEYYEEDLPLEQPRVAKVKGCIYILY